MRRRSARTASASRCSGARARRELGIIAERGLLGLAELAAIVRDESAQRLPAIARAALVVLARQIEAVSADIGGKVKQRGFPRRVTAVCAHFSSGDHPLAGDFTSLTNPHQPWIRETRG